MPKVALAQVGKALMKNYMADSTMENLIFLQEVQVQVKVFSYKT